MFTDNLKTRGYLPHFDRTGYVQTVRISEFDVVPPDLRTADTVNRYGSCHLGRPAIAENVVESLKFYDCRGDIDLFAYVIMPNHVHILARFHVPIRDMIRGLKSYTGRVNNLVLGRQGEFWQRDYFDQFVATQEHFNTARSYIELNPVRAGLCDYADEWPYSSAYGRRDLVASRTRP